MTREVELETTEARLARVYKAQVVSLLQEVVVVMEEARKQGFTIEFGVHRRDTGENFVELQHVAISKRW